MQADIVIDKIGQLVTCASPGGPKRGDSMRQLGLIENGAVAISAGRISGIGSSATVRREFATDHVIDAGGRVVCPGFVDPHTHIVFAGDRLDEFELKIKGADYLEILASGGGIISTVHHTRAAATDELVLQASRRLDKMLANGTTTAEIKTGYGLDTETELKMLRVIFELAEMKPVGLVPTFLAAHAIPPEFKDAPDRYIDLICDEMLPEAMECFKASTLFSNGGARIFADVFCERNAFDLEQSRRVLETAKGLGFGIKAHVDEFTNLGGSRMAIQMGAVSIDHLDTISDDEIALLAGSSTIGVVTPTVNFNFGSNEFADARKLIDTGCAVALSTDYNPGSAPCPSLPMAMAIACRYQKLLPSEALNAATINAAHAVGLGERVGSIEVGKAANLVMFNCEDYRLIANEFGGSLVNKVIKGGNIVYAAN